MHSFSILTFLCATGALAAPQPPNPQGNPWASVTTSNAPSSTGGASSGGSCSPPDADSGQMGLRIGNKSGSSQNYLFVKNIKNDCSADGHGSAMGYQVFKCVTIEAGKQGFVTLDKSFKGKVIQGPKNPISSLDIEGGNMWGYGTYVEVNMDYSTCGSWTGAGLDVSLNAGYDTSPMIYNLDSDVQNPGTTKSLKFGSVQTAGFQDSLWDQCGGQAKSRPDGTKYIDLSAKDCFSSVLSQQVLTKMNAGQVAYWGGAGSGVIVLRSEQFRIAADFYTYAQSGAST